MSCLFYFNLCRTYVDVFVSLTRFYLDKYFVKFIWTFIFSVIQSSRYYDFYLCLCNIGKMFRSPVNVSFLTCAGRGSNFEDIMLFLWQGWNPRWTPWDRFQFGPLWRVCYCLLIGHCHLSVMQLTFQKLPAQLRRSSRLRKVTAVLLAAYAIRKLTPYVWKKIQVRKHLARHTHI